VAVFTQATLNRCGAHEVNCGGVDYFYSWNLGNVSNLTFYVGKLWRFVLIRQLGASPFVFFLLG
jgi:hypothetical protein